MVAAGLYAHSEHTADRRQVAAGFPGPLIEGSLDRGEVALAGRRPLDHALTDQGCDHVGRGDEGRLADRPEKAASGVTAEVICPLFEDIEQADIVALRPAP